MALKPAGKAIVVGVVAFAALGASWYGGVFDKLKHTGDAALVQPADPTPQVAPATTNPFPEPTAPQVVPTEQPADNSSSAGIDAVLKAAQGAKK